MKAVVLKGFGGVSQFHLEHRPVPHPKEKEVLVRIKAVGFNPVDSKMRQGILGGPEERILGSDFSGIVEAVGEGTGRFREGDEVIGMAFPVRFDGSYAEYVCLPEELVAKKPRALSFEEGAAVPLAALTAYRLTFAVSSVGVGDTIFVAGLGGGVGSFVGQMVRLMGAKAIYTLAKDAKSAQSLKELMGLASDHIIFYEGLSKEQLKEKLLSKHGGHFFETTFDLVGGLMKELCLELTGYSGHFCTVIAEKEEQSFPVWSRAGLPFARNLSLHPVFVGAELLSANRRDWQVYPRHFEQIERLLESKKLKPPFTQVVGAFSVETIRQAHEQLDQRHTHGKLVMTVG